MITLTAKEEATCKRLVQNGDSKELAIKTVIDNREDEAKKEAAHDFYTFAYTN